MKKFLKSKAHQDALAVLDAETKAAVNFNPPLPLDPPPPDSPPAPPYSDNEDSEVMLSEEILKNIKTEAPDDDKFKDAETAKTAADMCRDYVRGTCTRPNCKYLHKHDLKQLGKVYTFCHNFQNRDCKHPNCKFAHATVFEEGVYRRTGYLPPHALAHHNKPKLLLPPPPPPENAEEMQAHNMNNAMPESPAMQSMSPMSTISSLLSPGPMNPGNVHSSYSDSDYWTDTLNCNNSIAATCQTCDIYINREQHTKRRAESLSKSVQDFDEIVEALLLKLRRLDNVLNVLTMLRNDCGDIDSAGRYHPPLQV